jgi:hypothetical protein
MITTSNSSMKRSGLPNQLLGVGLHTTACSGLSRVRTELFPLLVIPPLAPHPIHSNRQAPRHRHLGNLPPPAHHQVEIFAAPFRNATCRDLDSFDQQEAQHRTLLFRDVPQPSPVPTGIFQGHQSEIARYLVGSSPPTLLERGSRHCHGTSYAQNSYAQNTSPRHPPRFGANRRRKLALWPCFDS